MSRRLPRARPGVILQQDQADLFLVDTDGGEVFEVNATAAAIFACCEQAQSYGDAVSALSEGLSEAGQGVEILADVEDTVRLFQQLGLCEAGG
ncbi:PqqD family protein [Chondromyces apiculatus]|uniref:PqqD family protein n=1 Tax=Chondromyces apiculatus DSM 436 TaxID=1192034 RepID=A0A017TEP1_9BACT|nr:PqqD family protein [Chondromyces apiculatus]EYF07387.1 Hypothetical protein CAP_0140 [Chondromyces apiculatus DSM 436]